MRAESLGKFIADMGVKLITGIPDSTLQEFCAYLDFAGKDIFNSHIVPANEGAAVGIAIGEYLSTGKPACVYMQNSGLGNIVNPITSLANHKVYGIPMLLLIGWRGEPEVHDEPQHKFMGEITEELVKLLDIPHIIIDRNTAEIELENIKLEVKNAFASKKQYAIVIKKGTFEKGKKQQYKNRNLLSRELAISKIIEWLSPEDVVISTTGKISRELYEGLERISYGHNQAFLCVGGMGHANMIAYQFAKRKPERRVICLDGDGALLMHMGSLAVIGKHPVSNLIHICLDNEAHESVGGMYTGAQGVAYDKIAKACGYEDVYCIQTLQELETALCRINASRRLCFLRVAVTISSREDLLRPKESAEENKIHFMKYHGEKQ